jgi:hypothetical protein
MRLLTAIFVAALLFAPCSTASAQSQPSLQWQQPWSNTVFTQARNQHKFVLLDLEAVWCHVMDDVTYRDAAVIRLLNQRYILVKVDQDSRPDLSNRYGDWGWPATIVFAADGSEIVKRQGYIPPRPMASLLQAIINNPSPGPSVEKEADLHPAASSAIAPALMGRIRAQYEKQYDKDAAGWGFGHKYLDRDSIEYALRLAAAGNEEYAKRSADTLHHALALIDPAWGGMYQYSVDGRWSEPHFEKLISIQADALREYSLAYAQTLDPEYLRAAQSVHRFVTSFHVSNSAGVFFVSQDADLHDGQENESYFKLADAGRRAKGIPRVDKHVYARENGWMISALSTYYAATGDDSALAQAGRAAQWIAIHRYLPGGGFRHDDSDPAGPYLGDTLAMGQAFLALYNVSGDRAYLQSASAAAHFIEINFAPAIPGTGFVTSRMATDAAYRPHPDRDENIALVRFASQLALATSDVHDRATANEAMRYLASDSVALQPPSAGILLANQDATQPPLHVTVVGIPAHADAIALHVAALRSISSHELIEVRNPSDPRLLPSSITYPSLGRAALFLCTATACSSPVFSPDDVRAKIQRAERRAAGSD